ncbi:MAG: hypothetical protein ACI4J8_09230, partial [Oscillospiraceae bacterium]
MLMTSGFADLSDSVKAVVADCAFTTPYDVFAHILKRDYHLPPFPVMNISEALCRRKAGYGFRDYSTLDAMKVTMPCIVSNNRKMTAISFCEMAVLVCRKSLKTFPTENIRTART